MYDTFIDISPSVDYFNGVFIKLMITNSASYNFYGSCTSEPHDKCATGSTICYNMTKTTGSCTFKTTELVLEYKEQLLKG